MRLHVDLPHVAEFEASATVPSMEELVGAFLAARQLLAHLVKGWRPEDTAGVG